jgi:hypothetical protein
LKLTKNKERTIIFYSFNGTVLLDPETMIIEVQVVGAPINQLGVVLILEVQGQSGTTLGIVRT